jgi:hypothetical protein
VPPGGQLLFSEPRARRIVDALDCQQRQGPIPAREAAVLLGRAMCDLA